MLTVSLKENIEMVKNELNTEEQFFEKAVQTERFVKKYKKPLIGLIAAAILIVGGGSAYDIYVQNRVDQSNAAFNALMADANDQAAQEQTPLGQKLECLLSQFGALQRLSLIGGDQGAK